MAKILYFITQAEFGGAQRYVFDLANSLKNDHETAVAFGEQGNNLKLAKILDENHIKYFIIPHLKRDLSPVRDFLALLKIIKLIKYYKPDIIHLNSSKISVLGSMSIASSLIRLFAQSRHSSASASPLSRDGWIRIIYTVHGWVFNEPLPALKKKFYLWAEKFTAKFKDKIICVSEFDRLLAIKYKIAPAEKLITIHNGLSPVNFYTKEEAKKIVEEQSPYVCHPGLDPGSRVQSHEQVSGLSWLRQISRSDDEVKPAMTNNLLIGSIGNLYKTKGYEYFVQAADILVNRHHIQATFMVMGEGEERKKLENLIAKFNLKNNFILAGQIDEAARLLPALDLYVCSSVKEGLPYSILEAMQAGLPIISTDVGGIPEMIENNKTGLLVKPADAADLAEKIKTLLNNKSLASQFVADAKEKATREFGLEKMVEATKKVYLS